MRRCRARCALQKLGNRTHRVFTTGYSLQPFYFWHLDPLFYWKTPICLHRLDKELGLGNRC
jgi:hypothetical protein